MKQESPLANIRRALAAGDMPAVRSALLALSPEGREGLELRLGTRAFDRLMLNARTARRANRGRVVVIHGIMGGELATRDASGDEDLVWVHYPRLVLGRIEDFKLDAAGNNADPDLDVIPCGLLEEYLPLLFELNGTWDVLPFAFDWRLDMTRSADLLDTAITAWAQGEPVHIVAHSMGGVVARRFMQRHPATWQSMADAGGLRRGGRLVMMGTPNRGSFAIPFVLTGEEQTVRLLATFDLKHDLREVLDIVDTFVGAYQMLPSPLHLFGDARLAFYDEATWGSLPVPQALLDAGRAFQTEIDAVVDAPRMVYVAGFDRATPYRVRVDGPGKFSYQETHRGDGRVPHELGELPGVRSFYGREAHGDLPANADVLAGIHDLLLTGSTTTLLAQLPAGVRGKESRRWRKASEIAPLPPEVRALLPVVRATRSPSRLPTAVAVAFEQALVAPFVGPSRRPEPPAPKPKPIPPRKKRAPITVEVMWGDITRASGEVYVAGHYEGVPPINGELALDRVVSGVRRGQKVDANDLVITTLSRRGQVRAAVGDVNFFPWAGSGRRSVAIAGMGRAGTFGKPELQRAVRGLVEQATALPAVKTINTLLIGAGTGNLPVPAALDAMLSGLLDALQAGAGDELRRIRIVEYNWLTARVIQGALEKLHAQRPDMRGIRIRDAVVAGKGGGYSDEILMSSIVAALARRYGEGVSGRSAVTALLAGFRDRDLRRRAEKVLADLRVKGDLLAAGASLDLVRRGRDEESEATMPTRISFAAEKAGLRVAAIGDTAVVPERFVPLNWKLVDELVAAMTDPADIATIDANATLLASFVVPADFRAEVGHSGATIFEVDRGTARIHWEMLARLGDQTSIAKPIALEALVARQLRTPYSPAPSRAPRAPGPLRALVIGDPGSGSYRLEEARREALAVAHLLRGAGAEVTALIGHETATMLAVLRQLGTAFDILHYAGHGDFDPKDPAHAGWVFGDGQFFTARELGGAQYVPRLVVANACLTASLAGNEAQLLPGLADEFFKRGVRNYVGTAWPVHDTGAVDFARHFYGALLDPAGGASLGESMLRARQALKAREEAYGALWAAYQHYGDPGLRIS